MELEDMVEADSSFTQEIDAGQTSEPTIEPRRVGTLMLAIGLFGPAAFMAYGDPEYGYLQIVSLIWALYYDSHSGWMIIYSSIIPVFYSYDPFYYSMILYSIIMSLLFFSPRFIFVYIMYRHYKGRTSRKRTIIMGIVSELPFTIYSIPYILMLFLYPYGFYSFMGPTPLLLFVGLAILKLKPAPVVYAPWKGLEEPKKWWDKEKTAPMAPASAQTQSKELKGDKKTPSKTREGPWWEEEEKKKKSDKEPTSPWS